MLTTIKYALFSLTMGLFILSCGESPQPTTVVTTTTTASAELDQLYDDVPFDMPRFQEPQFPDRTVNILDFGAVGDGQVKNTQAFVDAINTVADQGGGTVLIPRGIWLTGPIRLRSNVRLHTELGALVLFSPDKDDYPLVETSFEGLETYRCQSPISGRDLVNVAFTGQGIFDGSGDAWRPVKKSKLAPSAWSRLLSSGGVLNEAGTTWYPSEEARQGDMPGNFNVPDLSRREQFEAIKDFLRPVMVSLVNCQGVLLDGPTFQNSPAWNIHPLMCDYVIIRNLTVRNPWYSQNGDGLDLESCKNVLIYNNTFDVGDDAICFKSGKNEDGRRRGKPTENVIVRNNTVYHGHGGFVVGSEMSGGVRNVKVSHCTFIGTDVGLRFKSTRGRGGVVENIHISDIDMVEIPTEAIRFNLFYGGNSPILEADQDAETEARDEALLPVTEETPSFRDIHMRNIRVTNSHIAAQFQGLPEMNLQNVTLQNATFKTERGITLIDCDGITLRNVRLEQAEGPGLTLYNSKNIQVQNMDLPGQAEIRVLGPLSAAIQLGINGLSADQITYGQGATAGAVE
ncbi:MAG: right-handed parallel beta-helix repeat-containing protein [Lewinella sp.]|nr:right-handed parallel beta-helix repeat-containing protein [Lewinella sp.]